MTKSTITRERLAKIAAGRVDARRCNDDEITMAIMLLAAMDSESVGTLSVRHMSYSGKKIGNQFGFVHSDAAMTIAEGDYPLYRHAQPVPVVPEEKPIPNTLSMYAVDAVAAIAEVKGWNACRAAMLKAQPQNAPQNIPEIIPNELIAAVNRLLDNNGSRGFYSAIECYDARIEVERLLAAARQEVNHG
ncbi:hypothetical protein ACOA1K_004407 [Klebsiella quasipneumoniae]